MVGDPRTATQGTAAAGNGQGNAAQVTPLLGFAASVDPYWAAGWTGTVVSSPHNDPDTGLPRPPTSKIPHYGHNRVSKGRRQSPPAPRAPTSRRPGRWCRRHPGVPAACLPAARRLRAPATGRLRAGRVSDRGFASAARRRSAGTRPRHRAARAAPHRPHRPPGAFPGAGHARRRHRSARAIGTQIAAATRASSRTISSRTIRSSSASTTSACASRGSSRATSVSSANSISCSTRS